MSVGLYVSSMSMVTSTTFIYRRSIFTNQRRKESFDTKVFHKVKYERKDAKNRSS